MNAGRIDQAIPRGARHSAPPVVRQVPENPGAYIRNPIAGKDKLTPYEVVDAISLLSSILVADDRYRSDLTARKAPDGR